MINLNKRSINKTTLHGLAKDFALLIIHRNANGAGPEHIYKESQNIKEHWASEEGFA